MLVTALRPATLIAIPSDGRHMARKACSQLAGLQRALMHLMSVLLGVSGSPGPTDESSRNINSGRNGAADKLPVRHTALGVDF